MDMKENIQMAAAQVRSDRVTDRRKGAQRLRSLLMQSSSSAQTIDDANFLVLPTFWGYLVDSLIHMMRAEIALVRRGKKMYRVLVEEPLLLQQVVVMVATKSSYKGTLLDGGVVDKLLKHCFEVFAVSHAVPVELRAEYLLVVERVLSVREYVDNVVSLESGNNLWKIFVQQLEQLAKELEKLMQVSELKRPPADGVVNLYRNIGRLVRLFISGVDFSLGNDQFASLLFEECSQWLDVSHYAFRKSHRCNLALEDIDSEIFKTLNGFIAQKGKEAIPFLRRYGSPIVRHCFQSSFAFGQHSTKLRESLRFLRLVLLAAGDWAAGYGLQNSLMVEDVELVCFKPLTRAVFNFPHLDTLQKTAVATYTDYLALAADIIHFGWSNDGDQQNLEEIFQILLSKGQTDAGYDNCKSLRLKTVRLHILFAICRQHPMRGPHVRSEAILCKTLEALKHALQIPCDMMILRRAFENEFEQHECVWAARCLIPLTLSSPQFFGTSNEEDGRAKGSPAGASKDRKKIWVEIEKFVLKTMLPSLLSLDSAKQTHGFVNEAVNSTALVTVTWLVTCMLSTDCVTADGKRDIIHLAKDIISVFSPTLSSTPSALCSTEELISVLTTRTETKDGATHVPFHLFRFIAMTLAKCRVDVDHVFISPSSASRSGTRYGTSREPAAKRQKETDVLGSTWDRFRVRSLCWLLDWLQHCVMQKDERYVVLVMGLVALFQPAKMCTVDELSIEERFDLEPNSLQPTFFNRSIDDAVIQRLTNLRALSNKRREQEGRAEKGYIPLFRTVCFGDGGEKSPSDRIESRFQQEDDLAALTRDEAVLLQSLLLDIMAHACANERNSGDVTLFNCFLDVLNQLHIHTTLAPKLQAIVKRMIEALRQLTRDHHLESPRSPVPLDRFLQCCKLLITLVSTQTGDSVVLPELLGKDNTDYLTSRVNDRLLALCKRKSASTQPSYPSINSADRSDGFDDFFAAENLGASKQEGNRVGFDAAMPQSPQKLHPFRRSLSVNEMEDSAPDEKRSIDVLLKYLDMVYENRKYSEKVVEVFEMALENWQKNALNIQVLFDLCESLCACVETGGEEVLEATFELLTHIAKLDDTHVKIPYIVVKQLLHVIICLDQGSDSGIPSKDTLLEHLDWILGSKLLIQMKKSRYSIRDRYRSIGGWFYSTRLRVDVLLLVASCQSLFSGFDDEKAVNMNTYCLRVIEGSIADSNLIVREVASMLIACLALEPDDLHMDITKELVKYQQQQMKDTRHAEFNAKTFTHAREFVRTEMLILCEVARHDRALLVPVLLRLCGHTSGLSASGIQTRHNALQGADARELAQAGEENARFTLGKALVRALANSLGFASAESLLQTCAVQVISRWLRDNSEVDEGGRSLQEFPHELFNPTQSLQGFYTSRLQWVVPAVAMNPNSASLLEQLQELLAWSGRRLKRELLRISAAVYPFTLLDGAAGKMVVHFCRDNLPGMKESMDKETAICKVLDLLASSQFETVSTEEVEAWVARLVGAQGAGNLNIVVIVQHLAERIMHGTCHDYRRAYIDQLKRLVGWIGADVHDLGVCNVLVKTLLRAIRLFQSLRPMACELLTELGKTLRGTPRWSVLVGIVTFTLQDLTKRAEDHCCDHVLKAWRPGSTSVELENVPMSLDDAVVNLLRTYEIPFMEGETSLIKSCYLFVLNPVLWRPLCVQRLKDLNNMLNREALSKLSTPSVHRLCAYLIELTRFNASAEVQEEASHALGKLGTFDQVTAPSGNASTFCPLQVALYTDQGESALPPQSSLSIKESKKFQDDLVEDERLPRLLHATSRSVERMKLLLEEVMQAEDECRVPVEEPVGRFLMPGKLVLLDYACSLLFSEKLLLAKAVAPLLVRLLRSKEGRYCAHFLSSLQQSLISRFASQAWAQQDAKPPSPDPLIVEAVAEAKLVCRVQVSSESEWSDDRLLMIFTDKTVSFDLWVRRVVYEMSNSSVVVDGFLQAFACLCILESTVAEVMFPFIIHAMVTSLPRESTYFCALSKAFSIIVADDKFNKSCRQLLLTTLTYLRKMRVMEWTHLQTSSEKRHQCVTYHHFYLDVPYLDVARAAIDCDLALTAIQTIHIWHDRFAEERSSKSHVAATPAQNLKRKRSVLGEEGGNAVGGLMALPENGRENELLLLAYRKVEAVDAVEGVQHGLALSAKVQKFEYEKDWASALVAWNGLTKMRSDVRPSDIQHVQHVMDQVGLDFFASQLGRRDATANGHQTEALLDAIGEGDGRKFGEEADRLRHELIRHLFQPETTRLAYTVLSRFQSLQEIQQLFDVRWKQVEKPPVAIAEELRRLARSWDHQSLRLSSGQAIPAASSYQLWQPLFAFRRNALQRVRQSLADELHGEIDGALKHQMLTLSRIARQSGEQGIARNLIHEIQESFAGSTVGGGEDLVDLVNLRLEQAHDCWHGKEPKNAIVVVRSVIGALKGILGQAGTDVALRFRLKQTLARTLGLAGEWLDETSTEDWRTVERDYLGASTKVLDQENQKNHALLGTCYLALARYIDRRFRGIKSRVESAAWKQAYGHQLAREAELQELQEQEASRKRQKKRSKTKKKEAQMALRIYLARLEKQCENDKDERIRVLSAYKDLLLRAIRNYGRSLCFVTNVGQSGEDVDYHEEHRQSVSSEIRTLFRLVALWFEHSSKRVVNKEIATFVCEDAENGIPSFKFLPLLYQIASRIGTVTEVFERESVALASLDKSEHEKGTIWTFEQVVSSLMTRLGKEHPFQTLPHLVALKNGAVLSDSSQKGSAGFSSITSDKNKRRVAEQILKLIGHSRTTSSSGSEIKLDKVVHSYDRVSSAFRHIAYHPVQKKSQQIRLTDINSFDRDIRAADLSCVALPVADIVVQRDARYCFSPAESVTGGVTFMDPSQPFPGGTCSVASNGASRPKVLQCRGTNGKVYKMLVKGGDDLRQDAVMEQLFGLVNILLRNEAATQQRNLALRTYKVVPLSPDSGIIEWVEGTTAIGEYLHGGMKASGFADSAHGRHNNHPSSITFLKAFQQMREAAQAKHSRRGVAHAKLEVFRSVCKRFDPVFRHFFMERFPDPVAWYRSRLAYTRSAAVNSIVGYVVGIGDRHTHNILIDKETAELVHIDFGFVFEQSKALRIPEVVPFRLTRDIVDAMGVTGTEGTFERCCEESLKVLRENSEVLLTICEVFIHDPLYQWTLSPTKAAKAQPELAINKNKALSLRTGSGADDKDNKEPTNATREAERALIRLHQKLQGYEDPNGNALSITGQVKYLIKQASSDENLCQMFEGWSAWV